MIPKIVIVGRPNVGKSSLLNMLAGRRISIVDATPGVTRDRISTLAELADSKGKTHKVELVDTGGHGIADSQNLTDAVERQIARGLADADVVLFVIDAQQGIVPLDNRVGQLIRSTGMDRPVLLVANKVDGENFEADALDALSLGFGEPLVVSAKNRYNRREFETALLDAIDFDSIAARKSNLSPEAIDTGVELAIVGKRNAGKSTLVNALAGDERVIVSEIEGTTRDSVDVRFEIGGKIMTAIDTAGVRKRKSMDGDIEYFSYHRALRSIRRADVVMLLIDASLPVSQVDKQLGHEIQKHYKPCIIVINKWDLAEKSYTQEQYIEYLDDALKGWRFAPVAFISAAKNEGVEDLIAMAMNLHEQSGHRVGTGELNRVTEHMLAMHPPRHIHGRRAKVFYVTQAEVHPPTLVLWVNDPELFDPSYQRYMLNRFRDELPYSEVPIQLVFRKREREEKK